MLLVGHMSLADWLCLLEIQFSLLWGADKACWEVSVTWYLSRPLYVDAVDVTEAGSLSLGWHECVGLELPSWSP